MKFLSLLMLCVATVALAQPNPVPLVNNPLIPGSAVPGGQDFTLIVNGTGFVSASVVQWNGQALATTFVSASQLKATVPAADIAIAGTASVTVKNPSPGGGVSNGVFFDIRVPFSSATFTPTSTFALDQYATLMTTGDLNGDAKLDLVFLIWPPNGGDQTTFAVALGNGDGTFQSPLEYSLDHNPYVPPILADFNGDGRLDLAAAAQDTVSLAIGNGDGTFQPFHTVEVSDNWTYLATVGDFNGDGKLDLAVSTYYPLAQVVILLGNGNGTFQPPVTSYTVGTTDAEGLVTGDFNGDGKLDLAVAVYSDSDIAVLLGSGDGTFQNPAYVSTPYPYELVLGDFNSDGKLDFATVSFDLSQESQISIFLGNGNGTFQPGAVYKSPAEILESLLAADVNGDGHIDLVTSVRYRPKYERHTNLILTLNGNGDGTFVRDYTPTAAADALTVGDFNGDGRSDLAITAAEPGTNLIGADVLLQTTSVLSTSFVDFQRVKVGTNATRHVRLSNIGTASFNIKNIALKGPQSRVFKETSDCGSKLAPGKSCKLTITFTPDGAYEVTGAKIKIVDSAVDVPQIILLHGKGSK